MSSFDTFDSMPEAALRTRCRVRDTNGKRFEAYGLPEPLLEFIQQGPLPWKQFSSRHRELAPERTIDFRKLLHVARLGRPFHRKAVAADGGGVDVSFDRPRSDDFSARLFGRSQFQTTSDQFRSGLFKKFPLRHGKRIFPL